MSRRLNDTVALTGVPRSGSVEHTIRSRKIENGYVVCESTCNPDTGEYRTTERFMKNAPTIVPAKVSRGVSPDGQGSSLADTVRYLGKDV